MTAQARLDIARTLGVFWRPKWQLEIADGRHQIVVLFDPEHSDVDHRCPKPRASPRNFLYGENASDRINRIIAEIYTPLLPAKSEM
jgi:hypothetical protein